MIGDSDSFVAIPKPLPPIPPAFESSFPTDPAPTFRPEPEVPYLADPVLDRGYMPEAVPDFVPGMVYDLESSSAAYDLNTSGSTETLAPVPEVIFEEEVPTVSYASNGRDGGPELEVISFNDPAYETIFSDTSTYEPPGARDDYAPRDYAPVPTDMLAQPEDYMQPQQQNDVPSGFRPLGEAAFVAAADNPAMSSRMDELFHRMAEIGASDLHLSVSMPPMVRKDGKMKTLQEGDTPLSVETMRELLTSIMPAKNQEEFARRHDTDFAYEIANLARFRCNVFQDRKGMGAVFRIIPTKILTAEQLGLSKAIMDLCALSKGLVVVTGPTGSGKSTTLCAMVDSINKTREDHIITIEDPIEFTHENQKCLVNQREVHNHTDSFKDALRAALREDPDILLVGEMRDLETISIAIETAETGHLVFGTLHTTTAPSTVDRIIDQFPADRQQQIRVMLSESLKGVIAQTLLPKKGGGRVAALEVLIITPAISNLIREGKTFQIPSAMQTGKNLGMVIA
jgi:twitching motility protein PilT